MQKLVGGGGGVKQMVNKKRSVADLDILIFSHGRFCDVANNAHKLADRIIN